MPEVNKIRVLRIIARLNIGGPAIQAINLSAGLRNEHFKTMLVCGDVGHNEGDMSYLAMEKNVRPQIIPSLVRELSLSNDLKTIVTLRKIIRHFKPDIIHTHTAKAGTLGRLAGISFNLFKKGKGKIKFVHTFHGHIFHSYFSRPKTYIFILIEKALAYFTDQIIVISSLQRKDICEKFGVASSEKVQIIPLGFDLSKYQAVLQSREKLSCQSETEINVESTRNELLNKIKHIRGRYLPDDSGEILLTGIIGRLTPVKNHRLLLDAIRCLKDMEKSRFFRFLIIGDGELRENLMRYSKELDVTESIVFTGWQKDMPSLYGALDIVALTSLNEGTPVSLIEAMAAARPVITTDVGGVRDLLGIVDEKCINGYKLAHNGILVPSCSAESLAGAFLHVLENRDLSMKMGYRARKFIFGQFTIEKLIDNIKSLYFGLVNLPPIR